MVLVDRPGREAAEVSFHRAAILDPMSKGGLRARAAGLGERIARLRVNRGEVHGHRIDVVPQGLFPWADVVGTEDDGLSTINREMRSTRLRLEVGPRARGAPLLHLGSVDLAAPVLGSGEALVPRNRVECALRQQWVVLQLVGRGAQQMVVALIAARQVVQAIDAPGGRLGPSVVAEAVRKLVLPPRVREAERGAPACTPALG
mmetsp:Transcript_4075/g.10201  ORF Transcript_4075/g.10201 Transcript_4075/m.10201 type:complete len:203 (+) Transcript_4075:225-833(+)